MVKRCFVAISAVRKRQVNTASKFPRSRPKIRLLAEAPQATNKGPIINSVPAVCSPAYMNGHSRLGKAVAVTGNSHNTVNKIRRLRRHGQRIPAKLVRRRCNLVKWRGPEKRVSSPHVSKGSAKGLKRLVHHARPYPVSPSPFIVGTRYRKRRSRKLLGIQPKRRPLRRVAANGQSTLDGLCGEFVSETCLVFKLHKRLRV